MKNTFVALLALAAFGFASPVPEEQAKQADQSEQHYPGIWSPPPYPPAFPPGPPPAFPPGPPPYDPSAFPPPPPPAPVGYGGAFGGSSVGGPNGIVAGGGGGGFAAGGGGGFVAGGGGGGFVAGGGGGGFVAGGGAPWGWQYGPGIPPPPPGGWPAPGAWPAGSPFNGQGVAAFGNSCSQTQQAVSCCGGSNSGGLLGGLLGGDCTLDLLSNTCSQGAIACCPMSGSQNGLINVGTVCAPISL